MTTNQAIVVEQLSKEYTLASAKHRHDTLQDQLAHAWESLLVRKEKTPKADNSFWALKNVSFAVNHGEVVGVIGGNGAGKSTLLKILSRITQPTSGQAAIHGRVASLLEVGTGFQPELSGRENIFLSGAILGMRKKEIERRFDEIVDFSGIEKFIDTPVKRYSSGMYVRLAFAVAAHLEPEIMLVDEVLAVGDAAFQKKCLGKMKDVVTQGRTVLFVSHNMAAVQNLCGRALLLSGGHVVADGATDAVVSRYLLGLQQKSDGIGLAARTDRRGNQDLKFVGVELRNAAGLAVERVQCGQRLTLALRYESRGARECREVRASIAVHGRFDENLFDLSTSEHGFRFESLPPDGTLLCTIPSLPLQAGNYSFNVYCEVGGELADWVRNAGSIEVEPGDFFGSGKLPHIDQGPFLVHHSWSLAPAEVTRPLTCSGV